MSTTTTAPTLESLDQRVDQLNDTVRRLQSDIDRLRGEHEPLMPRLSATPPQYRTLVVEQMREGMLLDPRQDFQGLIEEFQAEWEALPEKEKRPAEEELRQLRLDPPLSEIIIRLRRGQYPEDEDQAE